MMDSCSSPLVLRDLLHQPHWSPFVNNAVTCVCMMVYVKLGTEFLQYAVATTTSTTITTTATSSSLMTTPTHAGVPHHHHRITILRGGWYLLLTSTLLFWPCFDISDWSWRLNAVVPTALLLRCFYKGALIKDPDDAEVQHLTRTGSPLELLWGPLPFLALLMYTGFQWWQPVMEYAAEVDGDGDADAYYSFPLIQDYIYYHHLRMARYQAAVSLAAVAWGEAARMVQQRHSNGGYPGGARSRNTLLGIVGVFGGTCLGIYGNAWALQLPLLPWRTVLIYGALATLIARLPLIGSTPGHVYNIVLAVAMHLAVPRVQA